MDNDLCMKIENYILNNKDNIVNDLISLASIPSVTSKPEENAPFGRETALALETAANLFKTAGFSTKINSGSGYALTTVGDGEKTIGVFGHSDVVPATEDEWQFAKPFEPVIKNGCIIGRGVNDDKSGVIMSLYILKAFRELGIKLHNKLEIFTGSSEEIGMEDVVNFVKEQKIPDVSLVPDCDFPFSAGEKGILRFLAECNTPFKQIKAFEGGSAYNVVLGKVKAGLFYNKETESEIRQLIKHRPEFDLFIGNNRMILTAIGSSKHAAMPEDSVNAAVLAADLLSKCKTIDEDDRKIMRFVADTLKDYYGIGFGIAAEDDLFGKLTCVNGITFIKDDKLNFSIDIRYGITVDYEKMIAEISNKLTENGFTLKDIDNKKAFNLDDDSIFSKRLLEVYRKICGDNTVKPFRSSGGTYSRYLKNSFSIGVEAPYKINRIPMPEGHGSVHQSDEQLCIDAYLEAIKIAAMMLIELDKLL